MSTVSAIGSGGPDWASAMKARMFSKVDSDGSGAVDKSELQGLLTKMAERSGGTAASAEDQFSRMDSDGSGSLSSEELDKGMRDLMPAPSSTTEFAQRRGGAGGVGGPPPTQPANESDSSATSTDPLDTNEDGTVSAQERAAGELAELMQRLLSAADGNGDGTLNSTEADSFKRTLDSALHSALGQLAKDSYSQVAGQSGGVALAEMA